MPKPRVILADDHTLLLEAFEKLLAPECDIVAKVADGRALLAAVREHHPDVVVLDLAMPLLNGIDAARQIKQEDRSVRLVFVTMNEDPDLAAEALRAGGTAYLLKRSAGSELLTAIREAMKHRSYVTPLVMEGMLGSLMHPTGTDSSSRQLTARQREVLQLLAEGKSMKEVASVLNVTARTIAFHKYRMMEQLNIKTNAELIQYAIRHHLI
ncbi:MAG TPA: response regulator transcription factor [Vicinamibacterales bacterium]|nr:response regulator transcription factor [Vicinamibacterales bacterium]HXT32191.1 response regulator transcription factor [Vicinamibacterales bacterium]